jgi:cytochrome c peroxidase
VYYRDSPDSATGPSGQIAFYGNGLYSTNAATFESNNPRDWGAFKAPTLREVDHTAPYMHDGSLKPLNLTGQEKRDLVAFLKALSGEGWWNIKAPERFPR